MQIQEITGKLQTELLTGDPSDSNSIDYVFSSDLMSDVLTINISNLMLITGLNNLQTIRTAEIAEISCILFARNKRPTDEMIELARKEGLILMVSEKSVFHLSGLLYEAGLKPVY